MCTKKAESGLVGSLKSDADNRRSTGSCEGDSRRVTIARVSRVARRGEGRETGRGLRDVEGGRRIGGIGSGAVETGRRGGGRGVTARIGFSFPSCYMFEIPDDYSL